MISNPAAGLNLIESQTIPVTIGKLYLAVVSYGGWHTRPVADFRPSVSGCTVHSLQIANESTDTTSYAPRMHVTCIYIFTATQDTVTIIPNSNGYWCVGTTPSIYYMPLN